MSQFNPLPNYFSENDFKNIPNTPLDFLAQLKGLSIFDIQGQDTQRTRVITTLIHGNEPSGFNALHQILLEKISPVVNIRFIVCNVEAAKIQPEFSHRYLTVGQDLNRYFSKRSDFELEKNNIEIIQRAKQIKQAVMEVNPEAVIDLHNTSGLSPAFGVAIDQNDQTLDLISLFTNKVILTGLRVGAIMEQDFQAPVVTIECGGAGQIQSHQLAYDGLLKFVTELNIFDRHACQVEIHQHPCRVELKPHVSVVFGDAYIPSSEVTLRLDAEQLNAKVTKQGEVIGWYKGDANLPFMVKNEQGIDQAEAMFGLQGNCIVTKRPLQIFMATTNVNIAINDCLFYATIENLEKSSM